MKEKTLRYPGHADIMRVLKDTGFFSDEAIEFEGRKVRPVDFTARLLFPHWKLAEHEKEFTILWLMIEGEGGRIVYNLFDAFDAGSQTTSMARTTGYTCSAVARLVIEGKYGQKGISPPEFVGRQKECFDAVSSYLEARKVQYTKIEEKLTA
jgi:saccharopine dehydrogenase-like NADP-dependent oxidoreductase